MTTITQDPEKLADKYRAVFWSEDEFPVDPVTIARHLGVEVLETHLPKDVSGALIKEVNEDPRIILETTDHSNRKRFSCAHELGHYASRVESDDEDRQYEYVDFRNGVSATGQDSEEVFANSFAACLLMPEDEMRLRFRKSTHAELAAYFGVSNEAMKWRLRKLNLL
ncbi:ImmA/IrrE family metallo-endopeptidase [Microbulbifer halophilus]|uniref:ImmA/IrrE family metallo-endopeptidase n=1 Tax=Microbulbifer halophilus TaxID=453963 RepID=A0ABW5E9H9_9GAMM|nr:ImmA/IrrE family metallo-endopeptidase [Microbulbifer halophilus]MCW8125520.1 ImmA/IrrE family metallo-endopeptidase [Microbulbifer halophilus]